MSGIVYWVARGLGCHESAGGSAAEADGSDFIAGIGRVRRVWAGRVFAVLDAGRGDVYVGDYDIDRQTPLCARMHSERLLSGKAFLEEAGGAEAMGKAIITPDAALAAAFLTSDLRLRKSTIATARRLRGSDGSICSAVRRASRRSGSQLHPPIGR